MNARSQIAVVVFFQGLSASALAGVLPPYPSDHARELTIAARSDLLLNDEPIAINNYMPVNDVINGRQVTGQSQMVGSGSNAVGPDEIALKVTLRLKRLTIKGNSYGEGVVADLTDDIAVQTSYLGQMLPTGPHFTRQDDVMITHQEEWAAEAEAFVAAKFEALFGESVYFDGLSIPAGIGGGAFNLDRLRTLKLRTFQETDGWLAIGWGVP